MAVMMMVMTDRMRWGGWLGAAVVLCLVANAVGQTLEERGYRPVDQTVSDTEPLRTSLRHQDAGLQNIGERNNVYRRIMPAASPNQADARLYLITHGVVASFDRSEYFQLESGAVLQTIPPNTVFHIGLPESDEEKREQVADDRRINERVSALIDSGMSESVDRTYRPAAAPPIEPQAAPGPRSYGSYVAGQRMRVLEALARLSRGAPGK